MHKFAEEIMECVKAKVKGVGIDNIEGQHLEELEKWCCIADKIAEYDYYYKIIEAMEKSEYGEDYDWQGRKPYTRMRDSKGRYVMRGYEEPMKMYDERYDDWNKGRMYSEPRHESEYDRTRRMYTESKMMNPSDKMMHLDNLNKNLDVIEKDLKAMKDNFTTEERTATKQKLSNIMNAM